MPVHSRSATLTVRVPASLDRRIAQVARQRKATKASVLLEVLDREFGTPRMDPVEVRRQSLRVSGMPSEDDVLNFIAEVADDSGWV